MLMRINTENYNEKRYGKPWIAKVDFSGDSKGVFHFGTWVGQAGYAGVLELCNVFAGDIIALGQKDNRGKAANSAARFFVVLEDGSYNQIGTRGDAYKYYLKAQVVSELKASGKGAVVIELNK